MEEGNGETEQQSGAYDLVFRVINKEGISECDRDFLSHIANIARRGARCCYFGRFHYPENGSFITDA